MFILKSLVAALALGLVQDTIAAAAAPACCTNKCGKSVQLAKNGKKDCSAFLIKTVTPTRTTTLFRTKTIARTTTLSKTTTLTKGSTVITTVTDTTDITITTIASETDYSTSTSLATVEETATVTDISTAVETNTETTTVPYPVTSVTFIKRNYNAKPSKPAYASACDNVAYTRACSCVGVKPKTTTRPAVVETVYKTRTAYKTHTFYKTFTAYKTKTDTRTSTAPAVTRTEIISLTTYTTIISGTAITATETLTLTESATVTETTVVVATETAAPVPPTCSGKGFSFHLSGSSAASNGWGVGLINSIGVGIYIRMFSGGSSPMVVDGNGQLQSWYGSDYDYYINPTVVPAFPAKVWVKSGRANVSYAWLAQGIALKCGTGNGPNYEFTCKSTDTNYFVTFCQNPTYYEWELVAYTNVSQLNGKTCTNDGVVKASCL
ncbi:hypothetical protein TWF506_009007 [Arthrobotrys conoides]|uniref:Uncharacterized protein n=1 Tax=Arthrobotrys conoides TaxID=74498 RepID=A0AAN8N3T2_9PEZI